MVFVKAQGYISGDDVSSRFGRIHWEMVSVLLKAFIPMFLLE